MLAWTLRGAPHVYRRSEAAGVAAAVAPWSEADAAKRIFDAAKPLREAGIPVLDALDVIAAEMREIVTHPDGQGRPSVSSARASTRRTSASAGCATRPTPTSSRSGCRCCAPVWSSSRTPRRRCCAGSPGGAGRPPGSRSTSTRCGRCCTCSARPTPKQVAGYVDSPVREVAARWPEDIRTVEVDGEQRSMLAGRRAALTGAERGDGGAAAGAVRPVPPGPGPRDRGAGRCCPQGPLAHARPSRRPAATGTR